MGGDWRLMKLQMLVIIKVSQSVEIYETLTAPVHGYKMSKVQLCSYLRGQLGCVGFLGIQMLFELAKLAQSVNRVPVEEEKVEKRKTIKEHYSSQC